MNKVNNTLQQRHQTYGDYSDQAEIAQQLKGVMRETRNWYAMTNVQRESLEMIASKISRILNGDPHHTDSWHDIGGYARLVEDRIIDMAIPPVL